MVHYYLHLVFQNTAHAARRPFARVVVETCANIGGGNQIAGVPLGVISQC